MKASHLLIIALLAAPLAAAQLPATDFAMTATADVTYLDPAGPNEIAVEITIGCVLILQGLEQSSIVLAATVPGWIGVDAPEVPVSVADCAGDDDAIITKTGAVTLTPTTSAPGLTPFNLELEASFADVLGTSTTSQTSIDGLAVDYVAGHTLSPAGDQTFQVDGDSFTFDLDIEIQANARTMVMFEDRVISGGTLNGVTHKIFEVAGGDTSTTYSVTWNAPAGPWTEETVTFYNYSHCLDREGCDPNLEANPVWTFVNANPDAGTNDQDDSNGTPAPAFAFIVVALALAGAWRRRLG